VPNIKKLACVVPEKNVTEIILWCRRQTKDSDPYMSPLRNAGDTITRNKLKGYAGCSMLTGASCGTCFNENIFCPAHLVQFVWNMQKGIS